MNNGETLSLWGARGWSSGAEGLGAYSVYLVLTLTHPVSWSPVPRRQRDLRDSDNTRSQPPSPRRPEAHSAPKPSPPCCALEAWSARISGCNHRFAPELLQPSYQHRPVRAPVTPSRYPEHICMHAAACSRGAQGRNRCSKQAMGFCLLRRWRERQDRVCGCVNAKLGSLPRH